MGDICYFAYKQSYPTYDYQKFLHCEKYLELNIKNVERGHRQRKGLRVLQEKAHGAS